ncbi:MAG TPA: mycofactocin-coupled SDR family oxidoreductase [Streptosporangiaceae bacterium]|nr:mycofactocin-coupled SDR family oxidoreductase [Streptosporangiaceae bacterium]
MTGRVAGKVAFITGAARGQGRSHAVRLAQEGADIIAADLCEHVASVGYPLATPQDLDETARQVTALGRRVVALRTDVRDYPGLAKALDEAVAQLGRLDIVSANAGILSHGTADALDDASWRDMIDINLTGVWHTAKAAVPHLLAGGRGGSIVLTSSAVVMKGTPNHAHYVSAKHGIVGLTRTMARELAPNWIRVNALHPGNVDTAMVRDPETLRLFRPDLTNPTLDDVTAVFQAHNAMPVPWVEPADISNALLFLASDEARYVTGVSLPVDAGYAL